MGYAQVYTEAGTPKIWEKNQMSKECADNRQELLAGMMYWAKKMASKFIQLYSLSIWKWKKWQKTIQPGRPGGNV